MSLILGVAALLFAFYIPTVIRALSFAYTAGVGALTAPIFLGYFWKDGSGRTRMTPQAAIWAIIIGGCIALIFEVNPGLRKVLQGGVIPGIIGNFVIAFVVTALTSQRATAGGVSKREQGL